MKKITIIPKIFKVLAQIILIFLIFNFISFFLLWVGWNELPYTSKFKNKYALYTKSTNNYPHPYLGYTRTKLLKTSDIQFDENLFWSVFKTNNFDIKSDPTILIVGGSLAKHLSKNLKNHEHEEKSRGNFAFSRSLQKYFPNKEFRVVNAAYGGKKQPQQYLSTIYLDLIGFNYDLVINLDGFNEIVLPTIENFYQETPTIFPRSFFKLLSAFQNGRCLTERSSNPSFIPLLDLLYSVKLKICLKEVTNPKDFNQIKIKNNRKEVLDQSVEIWFKSSNKLNDFLNSKGKYYIHAIQPNQYLPNSKILSEIELERFYKPSVMGEAASIIEKKFMSLNTELLSTNNISDLRFMFKQNKETLYRDSCCHLNDRGMVLISEKIISNNLNLFKKLLNN